jgi:hypothetical protein
MTALSIKHRSEYDKIGNGEISLSEFTTFLKKLTLFNDDKHDPFWWAALLYLGAFSDQPPDKLEQEFQKLGAWNSSGKKEGDFENELNRFGEAFGRLGRDRDPVFSMIHEMLEGLRTFA